MKLTHTTSNDPMYTAELYTTPEPDHGKQWVAVVTGTHPQYGLEREFINHVKQREHGSVDTQHVRDGALLEHRVNADTPHEHTTYYIVTDSDLEEITGNTFHAVLDDARTDRVERVHELERDDTPLI